MPQNQPYSLNKLNKKYISHITCACGCGQSMKGKHGNALYINDSHEKQYHIDVAYKEKQDRVIRIRENAKQFLEVYDSDSDFIKDVKKYFGDDFNNYFLWQVKAEIKCLANRSRFKNPEFNWRFIMDNVRVFREFKFARNIEPYLFDAFGNEYPEMMRYIK